MVIRKTTYILLVAFLLFNCAGSSKGVISGLSSQYNVNDVLKLDVPGCSLFIDKILHTFEQRDQPGDLKNEFNQALIHICGDSCAKDRPHIDNFIAALSVLSHRNLNIIELSPDTYEGIRALSNQPVIAGVLTLRFKGKAVSAKDREELLLYQSSFFKSLSQNIHLDIITGIVDKNGRYTINTSGKDIFNGSQHDRIVGQVYPSKVPDSNDGYSQIVSLFIISKMEIFDIQGHLDEWYSRMPHTNVKPEAGKIIWR